MIQKRLFILVLLIAPTLIMAQNNSVRNEIMNFKDTTLEFINNGRNLMINKLQENDIEKVKQIKNTLLLEDDNHYMVFYPIELKLLLYMTAEYDELMSYLHSIDEKTLQSLKLKIHPNEDVLFDNLLSMLRKDRISAENNIRNKIQNTEDRDFLIINLHYLIGGKDYKDITRESLNEEADAFLAGFPGSNYESYIRENIRYKIVTSPWGYGFEFFSGYGLSTGQLYSKFGSNVPFGVAFDLIYKNWSLYLRDYIGIGTTHKDIAVNGTIWPDKTKANTIVPEASIGYTLPLKTKLRISPFLGVGGLDFSPTESQKDESYYDQVGDLGSFAWVAGINMDIPLGSMNGKYPFVTTNETGFAFLRIRYGYMMPNLTKYYSGFEGNYHYITIGLGGIGHRMKRDY